MKTTDSKIFKAFVMAMLWVGMAGCATFSASKSAEPVFNGRPLSEWLFALDLPPGDYEDYYHLPPSEPSPTDTIRQIGTNAIPELLTILGTTTQNKEWVLGRMQSKNFRDKFHNRNVPTEDLRDAAVQGFGVLGTNAVSAIPQINKLLQNAEISYSAAAALAELGPEGFAALTNAMKDERLTRAVVWTIGQQRGGDVQAVTRLLIAALKSSDWNTRGNAARFLAGKDAAAIPALIELLDDPAYYVHHGAAIALGSYGAAARAAAPKLFSLYTNEMDIFVFQALQKIDLDAATKAETWLINSGPLNKAREGYTQTLLPNGKLLIAGGYIHTEVPTVSNAHLSKAELLDPKTGKWTETGEMTIARVGHTAVLLQNGRVLVAGGYDDRGHGLVSSELYDPATGKWTETGFTKNSHVNEPVTLQTDGKVWIKGDWNGHQFNEDELYDPATGKWTIIPKNKTN